MTKRLQVMLPDHEYREYKRMARAQHISLSKWVRRALGIARGRKSSGTVSKKLEAIRAAARTNHPTGTMEEILAEIEEGYGLQHDPASSES